ncbi:MAG: IscS subfamily cysteine desulfurase [Myxococcota bacterium]
MNVTESISVNESPGRTTPTSASSQRKRVDQAGDTRNVEAPSTALKFPIYMDNQATTPCDPRVVEAMLPYFTDHFGNAASRSHAYGWSAEEAVTDARLKVARLIGAKKAKEIIFTSGATESDNLALKGVANFYKSKGNHIITSTIEHKAILDAAKKLEKEGFEVTYLPVNDQGLVEVDALERAMTDKTILVSIMLANNEVGTVQPIKEIGALCRKRGIIFHTDAVQGIGKIPFDVEEMNVDLASLTAHKMYGPKGVGALYVRRSRPRVRLSAEMDGGGHEFGMRSGTLNVAGIVGMGKAAEIMTEEWQEEVKHLKALRDRLLHRLTASLDEVQVNGSLEHRLPHNLNISFGFVEGESLLMAVKDVAVSSGSACTSASLEPSYVLHAMGIGDDLAHSSLRFGMGRFNTEAEVDYVVDLIIDKVKKLRELSPLWEMHQEGIDLSTIEWAGH